MQKSSFALKIKKKKKTYSNPIEHFQRQLMQKVCRRYDKKNRIRYELSDVPY